MATLFTIFRYDWLQMLRSRAFWALTFLLVLIGSYAAFYGRSEVKEQQRKIAVLQRKIDSSMNLVRQAVQVKDTLAWDYEPFLKSTFTNRPDGIAGLSLGNRDLHKYAFEISEGTYYYNKYATGYTNKTLSAEIVNPEKQAAGHLDVSFAVIFLLPLYIILISYNVLSSEQESGTFSLLKILNPHLKKIIYTKLLLRWLIAALLTLIILMLGASINGAFTDGRWLYLLAAAFIYSLFWIGLIALVTSFHRSSGFNALSLTGCWLFFCLLLPASFNAVLNARNPVDSKTALSAAVQKANSNVFEMKRRQVADSFYHYHPSYDNLPGDTVGGDWYNPRWMRAVHGVLDLKVQPFEEAYQQRLSKRIKAADRLLYFSPALLTQQICNSLAGSDMTQMLDFDKSSYQYFNRWNAYLDHRIYFNSNRFTKKDFEGLPAAQFKPVIDYRVIWIKMLCLFILSIMVWGIALINYRKTSLYKS